MNFKLSVLLMLFGIGIWNMVIWLMIGAGGWGNDSIIAAIIIFSILGSILILVGFIGGMVGIVKERIGDRIEERRKEKYYKTHPQERK